MGTFLNQLVQHIKELEVQKMKAIVDQKETSKQVQDLIKQLELGDEKTKQFQEKN